VLFYSLVNNIQNQESMNRNHFTWTAFALAGLLLFAQCSGRDAEGNNDPANDGMERHDRSDDNNEDFDGSDHMDDTIPESDLKHP
jgi:hypothetical protein